jgi:hypothetical protein
MEGGRDESGEEEEGSAHSIILIYSAANEQEMHLGHFGVH